MQVKEDEPNKGRMEVWNEEFGQDRKVGYLDPGSDTFVPDKLYKGAKSSYGDWCKKHGFKYADKTIPKEWLKEVKDER